MRRGIGSGVLWSLVVLVPLSGGCGGPQCDTPQSTFEAAKSALASYDCSTFCACLTPEARDEIAAALIMRRDLIQFAALIGGPDAEKARVRAERIAAVLKKHGFNEATAPKIAPSLDADEAERRRRVLELVAPIKDRNGFIGDFIRVIIETAAKPDVKLVEPDARLVNLKIENDTATATFAQTREAQEETGPIEFERVSGEWKISRLPLKQLLY